MKITMTCIYVIEPIKAFQFYTEALGFLERLYLPEARLAIVASPKETHGTGLLLEPNDNPIARTYQEALSQEGLPVIVFGIGDIQKEYERLTNLGVIFREPPTNTEHGTSAVFEDTCGNLIQLFQV